MGISVKRLLDDYFTVEELKDALYDIGEPISGNKDALINRILQTWTDHNRNLKDLLGFLAPDALFAFCQFYKLDDSGSDDAVIRRIVRSDVVDPFKQSKPSTEWVDSITTIRNQLDARKTPKERTPPTTEDRGRLKWAKWIYYVIGSIAGAIAIIAYFSGLFSSISP